MTRKELFERLALRNPSLPEKDVAESAMLILNALTNALASGNRIEIRDFGSFDLRYKQPRKSRNPATGEKVDVPAKTVPRFKPGKEMRERVDGNVGA